MQCNQCGFENLPGLTVCIRCGSVLEATQSIHVHPPRAAAWAKQVRPFQYWINHFLGFRIGKTFADFMGSRLKVKSSFGIDIACMLLSVIPGLGHLLSNRFKDRLPYIGVCYLSLAVGLTFFGTLLGGVGIGLGAALHAWLIVDAGGLTIGSGSSTGLSRTILLLLSGLLLFGLYGGIRNQVGNHFRGIYAGSDIPHCGVDQGDYLIAWSQSGERPAYERGDVVMYWTEARDLSPGVRFGGGFLVGPIVGLPGETLVFNREAVIVSRNGETVRVIPNENLGLGTLTDTIEVPEDAYFCIPPDMGRRGGYGIVGLNSFQVNANLFKTAGVAPISSIQARAFFLYNPIWKRGFLETALTDLGNKGVE